MQTRRSLHSFYTPTIWNKDSFQCLYNRLWLSDVAQENKKCEEEM